VHAQPGAKRTEFVGVHGDALKIKIKAVPEDGKANEELVRFLAELFGVPQTQVQLVRGSTSRQKVLVIQGVSLAEAQAKFAS
jgi:hypothetical protein